MSFWNRLFGRTTAAPPRPVALGKTPFAGDFLRTADDTDAPRWFDDWVHRAVTRGEERPTWPAAFAAASTVSFLVHDPTSASRHALVVGALAPSRDQVGRRFPMVTGLALAGLAPPRTSALLPIAAAPIHATALSALGLAREARTGLDLMTAVGPLASVPCDVPSASLSFTSWAEQTPLGHALRGLPEPLAALHLLVEAVAPLRGSSVPPGSLVVRVPLTTASANDVSFWLSMIELLVGWPPPAVLWTAAPSPSLVVALGLAAADTTLVDLWAPDSRLDHLCDLAVATAASTASLPPLSPARSALACDPAASVARWLALLGPV